MWAALLPSSYYAFYVAALAVAVRLAVFLSLLVSADRVLSVAKFGAIKLRAWAMGRTPKEDWFSAPLPEDPEAYPRVRRRRGRQLREYGRCKGCSAGIVAQQSGMHHAASARGHACFQRRSMPQSAVWAGP